MALKGTLKDFGIADIFQLISHQSKTGILHLNSKDEEVHISFANGDVISAESTTRKQKDLLGSMLVRAGVISQEELDKALETQKRTLKRLGHILLEQGVITLEELKEITRLQTTETIYKLFSWESGTYVFEAQEIDYDRQTIEPIRSENILMEGFRMVDEWPMVRKVISSFEMTFKCLKPLPEAARPTSVDDEIDAAFAGMMGGDAGEKDATLGSNETKVYHLAEAGHNVQAIIDLSRLGEFETCKALLNLVNQGYLKPELPKGKAKKDIPGQRKRRFSFTTLAIRLVATAVLVALIYLLALSVDITELVGSGPARTFNDPVARELLDLSYRGRLERAIKVYRLETGRLPRNLEQLVEAGLVRPAALKFPWRNPRIYLVEDGRFRLLRPFE